MPNAAARFDDDFAPEKPARRKAVRRSGSGAKKKGKRRFALRVDPKKLMRYGGIALCGGVVLGIVVNALVLQKGRHPAPLFGKSIALGDVAAPPPASTKKAAVDAPVAAPAPVPRPVVVAPATKPSDDDAASGDVIGRLIQGGPVPSGHGDANAVDTKTVAGAQRALIKLGYVLKATGNFGPQTKKALEMFEKERHLPVNGELSRRVVKILAAESGLKIEH